MFVLAALRLTLGLTRGFLYGQFCNRSLGGIVTHLVLYLLTFALLLTGAIAWFGHSEIAADLRICSVPADRADPACMCWGRLQSILCCVNTQLRMFRTKGNLPRTVASLRRKR